MTNLIWKWKKDKISSYMKGESAGNFIVQLRLQYNLYTQDY